MTVKPASSARYDAENKIPPAKINPKSASKAGELLVIVDLCSFFPYQIEVDARSKDKSKLKAHLQSPGAEVIKKLSEDQQLKFVVMNHNAPWHDAAWTVCDKLGLHGIVVSPAYIFDTYTHKDMMRDFSITGLDSCLYIGHDAFDLQNAYSAGIQTLELEGIYDEAHDKDRIDEAILVLKNGPQ